MQRILMLLFLGILCHFGKVNGQASLERTPKIVVIDPGHGGTDAGAIGIGNVQEKDITLKIALEIARVNRTSGNNNLDIYLTRYTDTLISLRDRARLAGTLQADLFISIHCNWSPDADAHGVEAFVAYPQNRYQENIRKSIALALGLATAFEKQLERKNRGVKFAGFQVLQETIPFCPSILLEVGFISNPEEAKFLLRSDYITTITHHIIQKP